MCFSINFETFDYNYYDKRFCEYQIKEWDKYKNYYNKKIKKTKSDDICKRLLREINKAETQIKIYNLLVENIYNKKYEDITKNDEENTICKIKKILVS